MSRLTSILFLMLTCVTSLSYATQPFVRKAESKISETVGPQGIVKTVVNTTFAVDTIYDSNSKKFSDVLISQRIESKFISGTEGADSTIDVIAWVAGKEKYDTKLWVINVSADAGGKWYDFYRTVKYGCCGAEDSYDAFDFKTGKHVFSYTSDPVFVNIPNTPIKRDISYISSNAFSGFKYSDQYPRGVGVLTISTDGIVIDQVIFESDDRELAWSPKLSLTDAKEPKGVSRLTLWNADGKAKAELVKAFSVKLLFYGTEIIVPVNGDRFDTQKVVTPKSITIRRVPLPNRK